jgi:hypothetical protein
MQKQDKKDAFVAGESKDVVQSGGWVLDQISKIWSSPFPDPCRPIDALGWVWGFFNFYNYISQWIDAIDVVVGSVKKLWMLLLCLAR